MPNETCYLSTHFAVRVMNALLETSGVIDDRWYGEELSTGTGSVLWMYRTDLGKLEQ